MICYAAWSSATPLELGPPGAMASEASKRVRQEFTIELDLSTAHRSAESARKLLLELRSRYDLSPWEYTPKVRIAPLERPHSRPVLTLNGRHAISRTRNEDAFLSTYLHEQIHWALGIHRTDETVRAVDAFRQLYPDAHTAPPATAANNWSTYLHLVVNWLEIKAAAEFIGLERAVAVARRRKHYAWMYRTVVEERDRVEAVLTSSGVLPLPRADSGE